MSHFELEEKLKNALRLDVSLNKSLSKSKKKDKLYSSDLSLNVSSNHNSTLMNFSLNKTTTSKTPRTSPKKSSDENSNRITPGRKTPKSPLLNQGDRFIPNRSAMQFDLAHYVLSKGSASDDENPNANSKYVTTMKENLNSDLSNFRILTFQKKAPNAPTGHANELKIVYTSGNCLGSTKKSNRHIPLNPDRIMDAPEILDDYYLNLIDWSAFNCLAVALRNMVYLWNASTGEITHLLELPNQEDYISSVSWLNEGNILAVGTSTAEVQLWDVQPQKKIRTMKSHVARVPSLSWNSYILSSGCKNGAIHHHDVRAAEHHVGTLNGHTQEVCGLKWSPTGRYLASGSNDNLVNIYAANMSGTITTESQPLYTFNEHQAAVKALAWCPWQQNILASGGGTADRHIRFWNCNLGTCLNSIDTKSQVCALLWSKEYKEIMSGHGFANNELIIWKYPQMNKVCELRGHKARVLNLASSPDGMTVVSAGADESLRLWKCFTYDIKKQKAKTTISHRSDMMKSTIR